MSWLQLSLHCPAGDAPALEELLLAAGAVSVTLHDAGDEPVFEPGVGETPLWQALVLTGLFAGDVDPEVLLMQLARARAPDTLPPLRLARLEEQDWERAWLKDYRPLDIGTRLRVCPSWWPGEEAARGRRVLRLDPGLAFGTGTHPTTALCLRWLEAHDLTGQTLADFGCGSGILGIAALLLGANRVHAVDNDPQALQATAANRAKNALPPDSLPGYLPRDYQLAVAAGEITLLDGMMANILAGTLLQLAELLSLQVARGGWILLSGILREQADAVISGYAPWFGGFELAGDGDWVRIAALRT